MKPYLLDTNVLIALAWPTHVHHKETVEWFDRKGVTAFRTCPITEMGFIRISSHPSFTPNPPMPEAARRLLEEFTRLPGHEFWPDDVSPLRMGAVKTVATHAQVTDAYLLELAVAHDGVLATLDRGIQNVARHCPERLEVILGK